MSWTICMTLSILSLLTGGLLVALRKRGSLLKQTNSFYVLFASVFIASTILFIPIYMVYFAGDALAPFKVFFISVHSAIRLFVVDGEFDIVRGFMDPQSGTLYTAYTIYAGLLFVTAPILTFSFVFSFLKRASSYRRYLVGAGKDHYVFSELNEQSLAMAENVSKTDGNLIIFTDVYRAENEENHELMTRAEAIKAVCFRKDILDIDFSRCRKAGKKLYFFIMGTSRSENSTQALKLIKRYRDQEDTRLFFFSEDEHSDLLLASADKGRMKVKRVNMTRVLIDRILYERGERLFQNAREEEDGIRRIHVVLVGLGRHGSAMLRALSWFCQMDGYEVCIDAFDANRQALEKLRLQSPDLFSDTYNGKKVEGEACCTIRIHPGVNVETKAFADEVTKLEKTNYILVALGDDRKNLRTAILLRTLFARVDAKPRIHPRIQTLIYNSEEKEALQGARNFDESSFDIEFFGDLASSYSEKVIINSELEQDAEQIHCGYDTDENKSYEEKARSFWEYEYNYRSSVATAIHQEACRKLQIYGSHLPVEKRSDDDIEKAKVQEHRRWNAYMRSEGYIYSGAVGMENKNHMARVHHDLIPYADLPEEEKIKNEYVIRWRKTDRNTEEACQTLEERVE